MSDKKKEVIENKLKVKKLRKTIIRELKNGYFSGTKKNFSSDFITISYLSEGGWTFVLDHYTRLPLKEVLNPIHFWFLRKFYVYRSLNQSKKRLKESEIANISDQFFDKYKQLDRDSKLDEILK